MPLMRPVMALAATATLAILAGCSSSSSGADSATTTALPSPPICTQISGVLGNGPDPADDPVGYAEAQIKPLSALHPTNPKLATALVQLDHAYQGAFDTNNSPASKAAVRHAQHLVNAVCPGAAS
jgi:hypothetical protein